MSGSDVFRVGLRVGKYQLIRALAEGGFGVLWVARDINLDRDLAIKFLHPHHSSNPEVVRRFIQEARSLAKIVHPGIVTVYESGEVTSTGTPADGAAFIVMELLVGETLSQRLARIGRFTPAVAMEICRQVANALQAAHEQGIVHRDLKSDNIMLVPDGALTIGERAKVLDFGIAKQATSSSSGGGHTQAGMVFGTPNYMAPEQCRSAADANHQSDIYSLGCILFELLTGKPPFSGAMAELIAHHLLTPPPVPSIVQPGIPPHLDQVIAAMLAKRPEDRPASMTVVERILEEKRLGQASTPRRRTLGGAKLATQPPQPAGQLANPAALAAAVGAPTPMQQVRAASPVGQAAILAGGAAADVRGAAVAKTVAVPAAGSTPPPLASPALAAGSSQQPVAMPVGSAPIAVVPGAAAAPATAKPTTLSSAAGVAARIDADARRSSSKKFFALAGLVVVGAVIAVIAVVQSGGSSAQPAAAPSAETPAPSAPIPTGAPPTAPSAPPATTTAVTATKPTTPAATTTAVTATKPTPAATTTAVTATKPTPAATTTAVTATKPTAPASPTAATPTTKPAASTKPTTTTTKPAPTSTQPAAPPKCQGKGCIIDGSF